MKPKHQRLAWIALAAALLGLAAFLALRAFNDNLVFFYTPTDLQTKDIQPSQRIRAGGLVMHESVEQAGEAVSFVITDDNHQVFVTYMGLLPDLFREGQGVVVEGQFDGNLFKAQSVLAKHDENYMPPEVANALKNQGVWRHAE